MPPNTKRGINHIDAMRRNRSLLQKQLAVLLGHRTHRRISHYESGTAFPPFKTAVMLEIALGARLSELYPDLYRECLELILTRARQHLPDHVRRRLASRLLNKDLPDEHT